MDAGLAAARLGQDLPPGADECLAGLGHDGVRIGSCVAGIGTPINESNNSDESIIFYLTMKRSHLTLQSEVDKADESYMSTLSHTSAPMERAG